MRWTWEGCLNLLACTFLRKTGQDYRGRKCPLGGLADSIGGRIRIEDEDARRSRKKFTRRANSGYALALIGNLSAPMNQEVCSTSVRSPCYMVSPLKRLRLETDYG